MNISRYKVHKARGGFFKDNREAEIPEMIPASRSLL